MVYIHIYIYTYEDIYHTDIYIQQGILYMYMYIYVGIYDSIYTIPDIYIYIYPVYIDL